jgi:hypothetical protein
MSTFPWADLPDAMRAAGLTVIEQPGWLGRGHDGVDRIEPDGVLLHHTTDHSGVRTVWDPTYDHRPTVPQPRANVWQSLRGDFHLVASGRAYHAGGGRADFHGAVAAGRVDAGFPDARARPRTAHADEAGDDFFDGNDSYLGLERENYGSSTEPAGTVRDQRQFDRYGRDPYHPDSIDDLVTFLVVVHRLAGWDRPRFGHHRQHTSRKTDMSYTGDLWTSVGRRLSGIAEKPARPKEHLMFVLRCDATTATDGRALLLVHETRRLTIGNADRTLLGSSGVPEYNLTGRPDLYDRIVSTLQP